MRLITCLTPVTTGLLWLFVETKATKACSLVVHLCHFLSIWKTEGSGFFLVFHLCSQSGPSTFFSLCGSIFILLQLWLELSLTSLPVTTFVSLTATLCHILPHSYSCRLLSLCVSQLSRAAACLYANNISVLRKKSCLNIHTRAAAITHTHSTKSTSLVRRFQLESWCLVS